MPGPIDSLALPPGVRAPATPEQRLLLGQAREFEALLLSFLTRELTASAALGGETAGTGVYGQLLSEQLAGAIADGGGVGVAGLVYGQLSEREAAS
jgi:Rod binding domain-containing protein